VFESEVTQAPTRTFGRVSTDINRSVLLSGAEHRDHCDALMSNEAEKSVWIFFDKNPLL
jgi:hypothetical protein